MSGSAASRLYGTARTGAAGAAAARRHWPGRPRSPFAWIGIDSTQLLGEITITVGIELPEPSPRAHCGR